MKAWLSFEFWGPPEELCVQVRRPNKQLIGVIFGNNSPATFSSQTPHISIPEMKCVLAEMEILDAQPKRVREPIKFPQPAQMIAQSKRLTKADILKDI